MDPPTTPAADDGDLLHAVLAFLEDNDVGAIDVDDETTNDSYGSSHSDGGSSPTNSQTKAKEPSGVLPRLQPRRPKINRSRQRMRQETLALRERVLELQDRLEVLQGGVSSRVGIPPIEENVKERESQEARKLRALAWQAIAEHEIGKKQAAEEERERLRALLKEQKLAFRRLRRYLAKYGADSQWAPLREELLLDGERLEEELPRPKDQQLATITNEFEPITSALPAMYLQTGAVFADERLDGLTSSIRELKIQNALTPTMSIEALDSRLVPFDVQSTARAVWEFHLKKVRMLSDSVDKELEESEDCIRRVFSSAVKNNAMMGVSRVRMETRRHVEPDRVVMVQSAIFDDLRVNGTHVPNYGLRQFQWTVIGPPKNFLLRHSGRTMSQVEIFEVTVPMLDHVTGVDRSTLLRRMQSLCETTAEIHLELQRESVESILMDSLRKNSSIDTSLLQPPAMVR